MSNVIQMPVIAGVEITTDAEGRFNLNALHRASGLGANKAPAQWMRAQQAKELIKLAESKTMQICIVSVEGRNGGTFAHENLALEYAGWISPEFRWEVNQTFLDCKTGKFGPSQDKELTRMEILELAMESEKQNQVLKLENKAKDERIEKLESFFHPGMTITAFGKMLNGVNCSQMNNFCHDTLKWIYNESRSGKNRRFRARSYARDRYLTETDRPIGTHGGETFIKHEPKLLKAGAKKLYELYLDEKLPMKKTWNGEFVHIKFEVAA
ncbi:KilA-N domain-containing protein [Pontibacterium sp.]|uniref:KilA-N domain-containing protein n=1 Tax=Pontibacterium sp. TaxID=2036026 RepID=UPI0035638BBF